MSTATAGAAGAVSWASSETANSTAGVSSSFAAVPSYQHGGHVWGILNGNGNGGGAFDETRRAVSCYQHGGRFFILKQYGHGWGWFFILKRQTAADTATDQRRRLFPLPVWGYLRLGLGLFAARARLGHGARA